MSDIQYIIEQFKALAAIDSPSGFTKAVCKYTMEELTRLGYTPVQTTKGGVTVSLGGIHKENGLLLTGHIDTLGAMVSSIKPNGRLRLSAVGGLQANNCETENCKVYTRDGKVYTGCLQMDEPSVHVNHDYATQPRTFDGMEVVLDILSTTKEETYKCGIAVGDYVCFDPRTTITETGFIKSRFLDDKLSVAIILGLAKHLKDNKLIPTRALYAHITVFEEVGHGGCASVPQGVTEILGVDMGCVGGELQCSERQVSICVKDSRSPSTYEVVTDLIETAKTNNIDFAPDVYPYYGSDCDAALSAGHDLKHCLIGSGVYASHGYERTHTDGIANTFALLKAYTVK
ncbi:MAG: M42 family metallopeptidase [Oscillospiraceae bacterium]|nr:M42 family metallopeptidase [Oscillospiraceae bacterium]